MASKAASKSRPSRSSPELNSLPWGVYAPRSKEARKSGSCSMPSGAITGLIGRLYLLANSQSLSSWAGTDMTAPEP